MLGAVDGTHVRIQAPSEREQGFVCRKGYYSLNVQAIINFLLLKCQISLLFLLLKHVSLQNTST